MNNKLTFFVERDASGTIVPRIPLDDENTATLLLSSTIAHTVVTRTYAYSYTLHYLPMPFSPPQYLTTHVGNSNNSETTFGATV